MKGSRKARPRIDDKAGTSRRRDPEPMPEGAMGHLRQILDIPGYAVVSADGKGRITLFNRGAESLFGWAAGEMLGGAVDTLFPGGLPDTAPPARDGFQDIVGRRKDGSEFAAEVAVSRLETDGGPALTAVLREAREDDRAIFENAGVGIYRTSLDGRPLKVNPAFVAMMGYDGEDALLAANKDIATEWYVDPARRAEFRRRVEENGCLADFESEVYRYATGERIWVSETARVVRDRDGRPLYYEGTVLDITERKRAEGALRESEAHNRAILNGVVDGIITIDEEGTIVSFNEAAERCFGFAAKEAVGRNVNILMPEPERSEHDGYISNFLETGEAGIIGIGREVVARRKDGTLFPMDLGITELTMAGRRLFVGATRDITEHKLAQEALRESDERFRSLVDNMSDNVFVHDLEGRFRMVNQTALKVLGYSEAELLAMVVTDLDADAKAKSVRNLWRELERGRSLTVEGRHRRKDGSLFPVELRLKGFRAGGERLIMAVARDITEPKLAQEALRESEARYRQIADISSDWVWEMDANLRFSHFSLGLKKVTGVDPSYALGKTRQEIASPDEFEEPYWRRHLADLDARREFKGFRYKFVEPDGIPLHLEVSGVPIFDNDGAFQGYRGTSTNVTKLVEAEIAVNKAREEAETANRAKSDFLSSMSHELRTPMNAILGFGQLLQIDTKEPLSDNQRDYVGAILQGGEHLLELINDVLDLSAIEAGRIDLAYESVTPADVADECVVLARMMADKRGITINDQCDCMQTSRIWADRTRLKQVLINLLSNAVKYNRDDGTVTLDCQPTPDGMVRFSVDNTGKGVPADRRDELFLPFSRLGAETSGVDGTGIGLALCKRLVELMDGRIGFESRAGEGSTFWIELPSAAEPATGEDDAAPPRAPGPRPAAAGQRWILYVEDNPANVHLMEAIVKRLPDVALVSAHHAELALDLAEVRAPTVIIMDIGLPGMNGFEALKRLRQSEATRDIPVIALSAAATKADVKKGLDAGFQDYLTKPVRVDIVLAVLHQILDTNDEANDPPVSDAPPA